MSALAPTLQTFFTDRLIRQRQASPHTVAAYRDTLRLLVRFSAERLSTEACRLDIGDLDASLISAFLDHREHDRGNSIRTRNARLVAIRSLFRYAALRHPEHAAVLARVLAIPPKRFERRLVTFLTEPEVEALLAAPDRTTWTGRRDHTLLALTVQTGLRASELIGLRATDVHLGVGPHISCLGKGRSNESRRSPRQWWRCCASGFPNASAQRTIGSSRRAPGEYSAVTHSNAGSRSTWRGPFTVVHHCARRRSLSMYFDTPPR